MRHSEFIASLGGGTQLAKRLTDVLDEKIDREAVYKWAKLDRIPYKWRPALVAVARAQGVSVPEDFLPGVPTETVN